MKKRHFLLSAVWVGILSAVLLAGCEGPPKTEAVRPVKIADGDVDPAHWGKAYPIEYERWKDTEKPDPLGSRYKRTFGPDKVIYDRLSEYPFSALLYKGWGFGIEYNEPRGHYYMIRDQLSVDPSRLKAGGACLTCKTPYAPQLEKDMGYDYYSLPYKEVWQKIPEQYRELGVTCIDCHDNNDMTLRLSRGFTLVKALKEMGVDVKDLRHQQMRTMVCAQCHDTYVVSKDKDMKSTGVFFPWQGSKLGAITIENIIKKLRSDPSYLEWKQEVTGFKLAYIRHPEFELFSNNSVHWNAGVACADCHMPYVKVGTYKVSDHRVMSPLKNDLKACVQCHAESPEWLRQQVFNIQDRTASMLNRAGYETATVAKLFEMANKAQTAGKTIDKAAYDKARDFYEEAFYRVVFIGAENSMGFHNPPEALRVLGDATAFASRAEALLRGALANAGVDVPEKIDLELAKYLDNRGEKKLNFIPSQEVKDPFGTQASFER
jgi:nitrite reductase (cytochrome c-552)